MPSRVRSQFLYERRRKAMLNEEKVKLMTKLAIYEKREGKVDYKMSKYYRTDYIGLNIINSAIVATLIYMGVLGCLLLDNIEKLITGINNMDLLAVGKDILVWYLVVLIGYVFLSVVVYNVKYYLAKKKLEKYDQNLRKLYNLCKEERKKKKRAHKNTNIQNGDIEIL